MLHNVVETMNDLDKAKKKVLNMINEYKNVEKYFGGKATNLDFKNDPEGSRITINNWVENQTNNKK